MNAINWLPNPRRDPLAISRQKSLAVIESCASQAIAENVFSFHQSIPGYCASPLVSLSHLASQLNLNKIWVKDESQRFDLKAFKMLGASFAMANQLKKHLGDSELPLDFNCLKQRQADYQSLEFATATDGNHGRAVAWSAHQFGCAAHVFMPKGTSTIRLNEIARYARSAQITEVNYDETVSHVEMLAKKNDWVLLQDTAWPGYEEIPRHIMQGYFTLIKEFEAQGEGDWPTHIFLQAGVGSMAAAIAAYLVVHPNPTPKIILVEPEKAPCFFQSMQINDGQPHRYMEDMNTIMAGLACGQPSTIAWEILKPLCEGFVLCNDAIAIQGMRRYANPINEDAAIVSGESGAVTLGLLEALMVAPEYQCVREALALDENARALLLSTEGDTDPQIYQSLVNQSLANHPLKNQSKNNQSEN